jgi:hypothetical protein
MDGSVAGLKIWRWSSSLMDTGSGQPAWGRCFSQRSSLAYAFLKLALCCAHVSASSRLSHDSIARNRIRHAGKAWCMRFPIGALVLGLRVVNCNAMMGNPKLSPSRLITADETGFFPPDCIALVVNSMAIYASCACSVYIALQAGATTQAPLLRSCRAINPSVSSGTLWIGLGIKRCGHHSLG